MLDFFERQDNTRRQTQLLYALFLASICAVIGGIYLVTVFCFTQRPSHNYTWWHPEIFVATASSLLVIIFIGTLVKQCQLSTGGQAIADILAARLVVINTKDILEQRLIHVVEEMSIASGTPVPQLYILDDEPAINACVAGHSLADTALIVTRGCLEKLSRDELQGVIGHEFSHMLNGDMQINMKLLAAVFGIACIAEIGRFVLRLEYDRSGRDRSKSPVTLLALAFLVLGLLGVFCGELIRAAISRQKELLADASAVQFTRNPDGIAGALKKIAGIPEKSYLRAPGGHEVNHFLLGESSQRPFWFYLFATHPPLITRIKALDPSFDKKELALIQASMLAPAPEAKPNSAQPMGLVAEIHQLSSLTSSTTTSSTHQITDQITSHARAQPLKSLPVLSKEQVEYARAIKKELPKEIICALGTTMDSCALIYALLLVGDTTIREKQLSILNMQASKAVYEEVLRFVPVVQGLNHQLKLPIVQLAAPAMRHLSLKQSQQFLADIEALINADKQIDIFEYCLKKIIQRNIHYYFSKARVPKTPYTHIKQLTRESCVILSILARLNQQTEKSASEAFKSAADSLGLSYLNILSVDQSHILEELDAAIEKFRLANQPVKEKLIVAAAIAVQHDKVVTIEESELIRVLSDALNCPMPLLTALLSINTSIKSTFNFSEQ